MSVRYSSSLFDFVGLSSSLSFGNEFVEHSLSISSLKFGEVKEEFESTSGGRLHVDDHIFITNEVNGVHLVFSTIFNEDVEVLFHVVHNMSDVPVPPVSVVFLKVEVRLDGMVHGVSEAGKGLNHVKGTSHTTDDLVTDER